MNGTSLVNFIKCLQKEVIPPSLTSENIPAFTGWLQSNSPWAHSHERFLDHVFATISIDHEASKKANKYVGTFWKSEFQECHRYILEGKYTLALSLLKTLLCEGKRAVVRAIIETYRDQIPDDLGIAFFKDLFWETCEMSVFNRPKANFFITSVCQAVPFLEGIEPLMLRATKALYSKPQGDADLVAFLTRICPEPWLRTFALTDWNGANLLNNMVLGEVSPGCLAEFLDNCPLDIKKELYAKDDQGYTPLHYAAQTNASDLQLEVIHGKCPDELKSTLFDREPMGNYSVLDLLCMHAKKKKRIVTFLSFCPPDRLLDQMLSQETHCVFDVCMQFSRKRDVYTCILGKSSQPFVKSSAYAIAPVLIEKQWLSLLEPFVLALEEEEQPLYIDYLVRTIVEILVRRQRSAFSSNCFTESVSKDFVFALLSHPLMPPCLIKHFVKVLVPFYREDVHREIDQAFAHSRQEIQRFDFSGIPDQARDFIASTEAAILFKEKCHPLTMALAVHMSEYNELMVDLSPLLRGVQSHLVVPQYQPQALYKRLEEILVYKKDWIPLVAVGTVHQKIYFVTHNDLFSDFAGRGLSRELDREIMDRLNLVRIRETHSIFDFLLFRQARRYFRPEIMLPD